MKIQDLPSPQAMIRTAVGAEKTGAGEVHPSFRREMSLLTRANCEQKLGEMHQRITEQGMVLARRCDLLELKRYKEMVAEFMYEAVRFAYEFQKQSMLDARGRHRLYALIKHINQKLDDLTQQMLSGQADNLALMEALDELRGMLLDLYM